MCSGVSHIFRQCIKIVSRLGCTHLFYVAMDNLNIVNRVAIFKFALPSFNNKKKKKNVFSCLLGRSQEIG